jgi:phosphoglycolate phosphatase
MSILIFDLDGTLIDTSRIVIPSFTKALRHFPNTPLPSKQTMLGTFGLPESRIWEELMPDSPSEMRQAAQTLSSMYIQEGLRENDILIEGTREVLDQLQKRGHILTVASNCDMEYMNGVLDSQGIRHYFSHPLCLESVSGYRKADILAEHLRHFDKAECFMIGDRYTDIEAAKYHGIKAIGCDFGFGNAKELLGSLYIITEIHELLDIFQ